MMDSANSFKLKINNFQSISKADLEFVQGINVLVGPSNSGKSATLRAVSGVVLNPKGSQRFIKNGAKGLEVEVDYLGNNIIWQRNGKDSKYVVNGEEFRKVGSSNLPKILDKSGFVLDDGSLMNVEGELELPFPFDKNSAELFKVFEKSIFCVSDSAVILKAIKDDETNIKKEKSLAEIELDRFKKKLKALEELAKEVDLNKLKKGKIDLEELYFNKDKLTDKYNKVLEGINAVKELKNMKKPVEVSDDLMLSYVKLTNDFNRLKQIHQLAQVLKVSKKPLSKVVDFNNFVKCNEDLEKLRELWKAINALDKIKEVVICNIDIEKFNKLNKDYTALMSISRMAQNIKQKCKKLDEVKRKLQEEMSGFDVCPLCGAEIKNGKCRH